MGEMSYTRTMMVNMNDSCKIIVQRILLRRSLRLAYGADVKVGR